VTARARGGLPPRRGDGVATDEAPPDESVPAELCVRVFRDACGRDAAVLWFAPVLDHDGDALLTEAEREVKALILAGLSNRAIAAVRRVATPTTATQIRAIFEKLGVSSRAELVGLGRPPHRSSPW
jgi:DNA-binding CsgD family transcriptional regulator